MREVIKHYDLLIEEGNDPVTDPPQLKEYMDQWDGKDFIEALNLNENKSVLEIGVGTGRLALRVAPFCKKFTGIDVSSKTIEKAETHLSPYSATLICSDFSTYDFSEKFDVIYSSLTFMHVKEKERTLRKIYDLLNLNGRFVLSIDKNKREILDFGNRILQVYPDDQEEMKKKLENVGFSVLETRETKLAYIFVCDKKNDIGTHK